MTRLLYWNIRDFALNKIANPQTRKRQRGSTLNQGTASADRLSHILWLIGSVNPHIFILIETETAFDAAGRLVRGNGLEGAIRLLTGIRNHTGNNDWSLVPPIQTGPSEGVSVYYRSTRRFFTGPYVWPGGAAATAQPPGGGTGNYPVRLRNRLPNRTIPAMAQHNGNTSERRVAARIAFTRSAHHASAGNAINFGTQRAPYMTTFTEVDGGGAVQRNLTLFAIHSPASGNARAYLRDLENVAQITDGIGGTEVRAIAGDFNWNLMDANLDERTSYNNLQARGYTLALRPVNPAPAPPTNGYTGYFATHIRRVGKARYWSTSGATRFYPGYGYIGGSLDVSLFAIDNIFTQYGGGGPAAGFTIMNPVSGSPFTDHAVPVMGTPPGTRNLAIDMEAATLQNPPQQTGQGSGGLRKQFQGWEQYGHIFSVSDHFALSIDL